MPDTKVDPKTLTAGQIIAAITEHCRKMGSRPYYIDDEIARWRADPDGLVVFRDGETGKLRAYHMGDPRL